ncbi:ABC transporter ATP-binding protein [Acidimangrovimonas sediminis]|uniref:ABC transporter ATP-binding protein n=2 Tax=Albidovulum sediminis TaxID=3066345 RepID=A0ABT2NST6_9RHOB|nr:ABC transporter ATP-binding protein [Defluviimonas sediminis]
MTNVSLRGLSKSFGHFSVVKAFDLEIAAGEFVVFVGPSGCGKTTTLRMIAGLELPTGGEIFIGSRDVTDLDPRDRRIAMVFQSYALYPHMTIRENLGFALKLAGVPKEEIARKVEAVADTLGLQQYLQAKPRTLSGGQRQRVALGRAIIREPDVFLFDEPLSNLDAKLRSVMRNEIIRLHKSLKSTMIYVTHDQVEAMTMGDRIVVMHGGVAQQIGTPLEVYDEPANLFVATFIGSPSMNILEGEVENGKFQCQGISIDSPVPVSGKAFLGIRPEHLRIVPHDTPGAIRGTLGVVEHLGAETIIELLTDGPVITARIPRADGLSGGAELYVAANHIHLFDKDGNRIETPN